MTLTLSSFDSMTEITLEIYNTNPTINQQTLLPVNDVNRHDQGQGRGLDLDNTREGQQLDSEVKATRHRTDNPAILTVVVVVA